MISALISYLTLYGATFNIVASSGAGALNFEREKMYPLFSYLSTLFTVLGVAICAILTYSLNRFLLLPLDLGFAKFGIIVTFAGLFNLLVAFVWGKISNFYHYLYNSSFSYVFDTVFTAFVVMSMDLSCAIMPFFMSVAAIAIVIIVTNSIISFFVRGFNRGYLNVNFRNVPTRLFFMAIIAMIVYYIAVLVV